MRYRVGTRGSKLALAQTKQVIEKLKSAFPEDEFDVVPPEGNVFVNHEINGRSGHLGHALVEYEEGKILAFYPN